MGLLFSVIDQNYPPKAKWGINDIPDLSSKITIVTGASSGLGYETAKALLSHNATVYLACRDSKKTTSVIEKLKQETGKTAIFLELDLASLESVKNAAENFKKGVMCPPMEQLTKEGYDLQFGTNVLGHFYFTSLLLPELKAGAQTSPDGVSRVIHTSSQIHVLANLNYETFIDSQARRKLGLNGLYGQSKFVGSAYCRQPPIHIFGGLQGNIVFSNELARRHGKDGITSIAVHPGSLTTDLGRHISPFVRRIIHFLSHTPPEGALTQLYGGTAPEAATLNGQYLIPYGRIGKPAKETLDETEGKSLWEWLEEQVQKYELNSGVSQ